MSSSFDEITIAPAPLAIRKVAPVPVGHLTPNPFQPRLVIDDEDLAPLIESIRRYGFMGHIEVRRDPHDPSRPLQIVFGHRRVEAAKRAGLATVPAAVVERSDEQMRRITFVENAARKALGYWEEALFLGTMKRELGLSVRQIAEALGTSRTYVQERLDILKLPEGALREAAQRDEVGFSTAWLLTQMPAEDREELFTQVRRGVINVSDLRMIRRAQARRREQLEQRDDTEDTLVSVPAQIPPRLTWVEPPSAMTDVATRAANGPRVIDSTATDPALQDQTAPPVVARPSTIRPAAEVRTVSERPEPQPVVSPLATMETTAPVRVETDVNASPVAETSRIVFDRTIIARNTAHDYAVEAVKQLEANAYHLRLKLAKSDFSGFDAEQKRRLKQAKTDLREALALLP